MPKIFLLLAAISGALSVMLGAFAAHGLKSRLSPELLSAFKTAVDYQFYHTLALLLLALLLKQAANSMPLLISSWLMLAGILLFSGSLYLLALGGPKWLGPITPLGGLCFIGAWVSLAWFAASNKF